MSGNNYYYGDNVNMYGGQGNTGIVKTQTGAGAAGPDPALVAALAELHRQIAELRALVPAPSAQLLEESLPALSAEAAVPAQERHRALMAIAGIAATVGAVGRPVAQAVQAVVGLLGG
ncbi:hypothetical protein KBP30_18175 [Streptomyces sp. Go40/10]|uniref:hypothetical protein n=1 Tax=Streptomyces sp. Go40/10 TaxID=2825844 RepID=UPI001E305F30|nr:hypothetical protein [Streptomyces sp. Go40/10]UFR02990.1 hypothetical protein KBP30_18175 [Streptomyces sp. Go40/10]